MERLEPAFTQRRRAAGCNLPDVRFTLSADVGSVGMTVTAGSVRAGKPVRGARVRIPQRWLYGLLSGYHAIGQIAPLEGVSVPSRLLPVMGALFPAGWPFVYQGDSY